ncbi:MAG TPA: MMPL family transporter [Solirubrobacteraceae bacterium]|jgi:RND superfamily putative drug exporter|nr:MMPL family transporter [Solirubrobacteraceae bacterium]
MMTSITRWVLAHKRIVALAWLVVTVVGIATVGKSTGAFSTKFSVPGREGFETNQRIAQIYHQGGQYAPLVPVVTLPAGTSASSPAVRAGLLGVESKLRAAVPGLRTASYADTGNRAFVSADGRTTFVLAYPPPDNESFGNNTRAAKTAARALAGDTIAGAPVHLTGLDALANQTGGSSGPGVFVEAMLGGAGALLVLAFVFASLLALIPILMAVVSIMTTFLVLWGVTQIASVSMIVEFLVALIGLGVAIDYSLLVVVRWREERAHGRSNEEAVVRAMQTAGRAVVLSGTTVAIGLLAMVVLPLPFLRSIGFAGMLIPLVSVIVAVTLLPVVLSKVGSRLDWPHVRTDDKASRSWTSWARFVVRRRWVAAGGAALVLAALVLAATSIQPGTANVNDLSKQGDARLGLLAIERSGIGPGALEPIEILVGGGASASHVATAAAVNGVHGAVAPAGWHSRGTALVDAIPVADGSTSAGRDTVTNVRAAAHAVGPGVRVGGIGAQNSDFVSAIYGSFPLMIALIAVLTFVLLARAFRSLLLPLKAVLLNVISVSAAWGVITLVWQEGHGSNALFGIAATHSITSWIPLMVFAFLFGLSMDYEVFILARMREEFDKSGSTDAAVVRGIGRTGRLVTSAALILFLAFVSMASGPETDVKVFATGLAAGILLDATVIRALLVPAIVSLFGRWNWWLPERPARWLRVAPSLPPRPAPAESTAS